MRYKMCGTSILIRRLGSYAFLVVCGFCIGVTVNYYGLLFESIRIEVRITHENEANWTVPGSNPNTTERYLVPNIVHFIWFAQDKEKKLSFLNYVSIMSAHKIQQPEAIFLHHNFLPTGEWWERLLREVRLTLVYKVPANEIHGQTIAHAFHKGDIAKMEILLEYGGIYLDYDVILINNLNPVRKYEMTLGKERSAKFNAGVMVARQRALFLVLLYESYRNNYRSHDWDYNCARVAYQIYLARPDLIHVEPYKFTTPDWTQRHLLWNSVIKWTDLYLIHIMGHKDKTVHTPESIKRINSTFGEIMRLRYYGNADVIVT